MISIHTYIEMQCTAFNVHFLSLTFILSIFLYSSLLLNKCCWISVKSVEILHILWIHNHMHHTRMTACSLPQRSRSLGPGRSHQELRSPRSTLTVTSRLSAARPVLHQASHGTISLSHAGPYRWTPGGLENRESHWSYDIYSASHVSCGFTGLKLFLQSFLIWSWCRSLNIRKQYCICINIDAIHFVCKFSAIFCVEQILL